MANFGSLTCKNQSGDTFTIEGSAVPTLKIGYLNSSSQGQISFKCNEVESLKSNADSSIVWSCVELTNDSGLRVTVEQGHILTASLALTQYYPLDVKELQNFICK